MMKFEYCDNDFLFESSWTRDKRERTSTFDLTLQNQWKTAMEQGVFRYALNIKHWKILPGKFSFVAQLNTDRAEKRRAPEEISTLTQPFDHTRFNFTKVKENEILFELKRKTDTMTDRHFMLINVSPFEVGHSLLTPMRLNCLPQLATLDSLQLAIEVFLLSADPAFRLGFNSLCGYASVNHLHYHVYYFNHCMLLEHIEVKQLSGSCFILTNYPAKGFVFELPSERNIQSLARDVYKLTNFLQQNNVAHNIYMTRGTRFVTTSTNLNTYDTVRVYVWARKSSSGAKQYDAFNPALCELFGHLTVKKEADYWSLKESLVVEMLSDICEEPFNLMKDAVSKLFSETISSHVAKEEESRK